MKNLLNSVKLAAPRHSSFDRSFDHKLTGNMGQLLPVYHEDVGPADRFNITCETMIRFAPMLAPIMHRVDVTVHFFFVPYRILWPSWTEFIEHDNSPGGPAMPYIEGFGVSVGSLFDYFNLPLTTAPANIDIPINALPFAAYNKCFNEYYRDENLVVELNDELLDGLNSAGDFQFVQNRAWEHDPYTACLPWAQKGNPVEIFGGEVVLKDPPYQFPGTMVDLSGTTSPDGQLVQDTVSAVTGTAVFDGVSNVASVYDPNGSLTVDAVTINELRAAEALQEFLEREALGGTRYTELIRVMFGVISSDARLQRPEFLGGIKVPVVVSEVLQTSSTDSTTPQGNMAGHGISVGMGRGISASFEEHGCILGIMSVMPKTAYQQGVPRFFRKFDKYDFFWPKFEHIGEQPVPNSEVYFDPGGAYNGTFGYQPRYTEYKAVTNKVSGEFRTTLAFWHLGRIFNAPPALNASFVTSNPSTRIFAVDDPAEHHLWCHCFFRVRASRPMSFYSTPKL